MVKSTDVIPNIDIGVLVCEALGIDPMQVGRIIIDIDASVSGPVKVYTEMYAMKSLLDIDWSRGLKGASIVCNDSTVAREDIGDVSQVDKAD